MLISDHAIFKGLEKGEGASLNMFLRYNRRVAQSLVSLTAGYFGSRKPLPERGRGFCEPEISGFERDYAKP